MTDRQEIAQRVEALRARLDYMADQFQDGHTGEPAEYQRILNTLCKTLLQLEYAGGA